MLAVMIGPFVFVHIQETSSKALLTSLFSSRFGRTHHKTGYLPAPFLVLLPEEGLSAFGLP